MNTNKHNPGGHERKIVTKLMNAEKNNMNRVIPSMGAEVRFVTAVTAGGSVKFWPASIFIHVFVLLSPKLKGVKF